MKKAVLLISLCWCSHFSFSQIFLGPKAGMQISKTATDDEDYNNQYNVGWKPGLSVGAILNYPVTKTFGLHGEFSYSRKGKIATLKDGSQTHKAIYNFVELPLLLNINIPQKKYTIFFNVGPNMSYWLSSKGVIDTENLDIYQLPPVQYKVEFSDKHEKNNVVYVEKPNRLHYGLLFGAGTTIKLDPKQRLSIEVRYEAGHSNFGESEDGKMHLLTFQEQLAASSRVVNLSVSYWYKINFRDFKKGKSKSRN